MTSVVDYILIRKTYEYFKEELSPDLDVKELKIKLKKFISFVSSLNLAESFRNYIAKQKELAKELVFVINIRYLIAFIYRYIIYRLLTKLLSLIDSILMMLNNV